MLGSLVAILVTLAGILAVVIKSWQEARAANNAVNNIGPGEHRLYDRIQMIHDEVMHLREGEEQFQSKGWPSLPEDLGSAAALTSTIRDLQRSRDEILARLAELSDLIRAHDRWERQSKYGDGG